MYRAYLDASGTHAGSPLVCLAGYVGTQGQWAKFKTRWNRVLAKSGVDRPFHMTDFMSGKARPYRDWSPGKREAVLEALVDTITGTMTVPIVSLLSRPDYEKLAANLAEHSRTPHPNTEYMLCAIGCMARVAPC